MEHNNNSNRSRELEYGSFADHVRQRRVQNSDSSDENDREEEDEVGDAASSSDLSFVDAVETLASHSSVEIGVNAVLPPASVSFRDRKLREDVVAQIGMRVDTAAEADTRRSFILDRFLPAAELAVTCDLNSQCYSSSPPPPISASTVPISSRISRSLPRPSSPPVRRRSQVTSAAANTRRSGLQAESDIEATNIKACGFLPSRIRTALSCAPNNQQGPCCTTSSTIRTMSKIAEENSGSSDDDSELVVRQVKSTLLERRAKLMLQLKQQAKDRSNSSIAASNLSQVDKAAKSKTRQGGTETLPFSCSETPRGVLSLDGQSTVEIRSPPSKPLYSEPNAANGLSHNQLGENTMVDAAITEEEAAAVVADNLARTRDKVGWPLGISSCYKWGSPRKLPVYKNMSVLSPPLPKSPAQPWLWKSAPSMASILSPLSSSPSTSSSSSSSTAASSLHHGAKKQLNFLTPSAELENAVNSRRRHPQHII